MFKIIRHYQKIRITTSLCSLIKYEVEWTKFIKILKRKVETTSLRGAFKSVLNCQIWPQKNEYDTFKKKLLHVQKEMQRKMLINYNKLDGSCKLCLNHIQNASNNLSTCFYSFDNFYEIVISLSSLSISTKYYTTWIQDF